MFKHISSKNADYGAAEQYLTSRHDEFTMKPTLDENGRLLPHDDYRIASLNCGGEWRLPLWMKSSHYSGTMPGEGERREN